MNPPDWLWIPALLLALNLYAFTLFGIDKSRALKKGWRIPEGRLLTTALLGGFVGAKLGQRHFRHKTRKEPFARLLNAIGFLHAGLLVLFLTFMAQ